MTTHRMQFDDTMEDEEESVKNDHIKGSDWIHALEASKLIDKSEKDNFRDLSFSANWTLSSCKVDGDGFGVNELLSDSVESYWQSDGPQPHAITVEFPRKTDMSFLAIYLDFKSDESYTPSKVVARLGASLMHLDEEYEKSFNEPNGWQIIDLRKGSNAKRAFVLQLQIIQNHQNGRDTHIRHMRVIGPSRSRFDTEARTIITPQVRLLSRRKVDEVNENDDDDAFREDSPPLLPISSLSRSLKSMHVIR